MMRRGLGAEGKGGDIRIDGSRVGKMPAFMSKVHAGGIYRYLPAFTGIYRRLLTLLHFVTVSLY